MWLYNEVYSISNGVKCHAIADRLIYFYLSEVSPTIEWLCSIVRSDSDFSLNVAIKCAIILRSKINEVPDYSKVYFQH